MGFERAREQDSIICRSIIELFSRPALRAQLAFCGGTALHKLFLSPACLFAFSPDGNFHAWRTEQGIVLAAKLAEVQRRLSTLTENR